MLVPKRRLGLVSESKQGHYRLTVSHKCRLWKVGIQHLTFKHRSSFMMRLPYYYRDSRLDDTCFLKSDFR